MRILNSLLRYSLAVVIASFLLAGCDDDRPVRADYTGYAFSKADTTGGDWHPVLLNDSGQIPVDAPADIQSPEYLAELAAVRAAASNRTGAQQAAVDYWTNNPVIRWNEIALKLIAKYNLIPGPNADGTYTLPNPANPGGTPNFPFSHPPYAVRALAYLSVGQFDGMITACHYQFLYHRPAPARVDDAIPAAYPDNGVPSYPSDAAVVAAVSRDILSAMFPLEQDYLADLAEEHMNSLLWAGANVQSDIDAGQQIGVEIAKIALARATSDGMSKAQCPKPVSDSIAQAAEDRYGWRWVNLEIPERPVGLVPLYGQVKMWSIADVTTVRLPVPPTPGSPDYQADEDIVRYHFEHMTPEKRAIANFWEDGINTYTPPGHWNRLLKEYAIQYRFNPLRTARGFAYLNMAMMDAGIACWDSKYHYFYPRPINFMPDLRPIAGTPNFPSYPSGHATFSAAGGEVLTYLFPEEGSLFRDYALEAAISRVYGGIHWKFDSDRGNLQGIDAAGYTLDRARADGAD